MFFPHAPAAVIFDMDGLLFDTETFYRAAFLDAGVETGYPVTAEIFLELVGKPWPASRALLLERLGQDFAVDTFKEACRDRFEVLIESHDYIKPGVVELLDALDDLDLPRAIATSSAHERVRHHLSKYGLAERFHCVVAFGDYRRGKPSPDPFLVAAERLGVDPSDCLALEDSLFGVMAASSAGMMTCMVPDLIAPTEDIRGRCAHIASDLHEIRGMLVGETRIAALG